MPEEQVIADGLTALDWLRAAAIFVAGIAAGKVVRMLLSRRVNDEDTSEPGAALVIGRIAGSFAVLAGLVYALSILDVRIGPLLGAIGIGGIAVALAAQSLLASFIASVLLQIRRPFRRGEHVMIRDLEGRVEEINFRTVVLRAYDGERTFIPCNEALNSPIVNYSSRGARRTTLTVGVDYGTDLEKAQRVLAEALAGVEGVWDSPPPEALVEQFGESSVDFAVRWWHEPDYKTMWEVRSRVAMAVYAALDRVDIDIAYPRQVVHVASLPRVIDLTDGEGDGEHAQKTENAERVERVDGNRS